MSPKSIRTLLVMAALALAVLLAVQIVWFQRAFALQDRQFAGQVNTALRETAHRLLALSGDSLSLIPAVERRASNDYALPLGRAVIYDSLPRLLTESLARAGIRTGYLANMEDCRSGAILLGYVFDPQEPNADVACDGREQASSCFTLSVVFPGQRAYLNQRMTLWYAVTGASLLVLIFFVYSLRLLLREKRLGDMRRDFLNNMTHELKTPLTNIGLASEMLQGATSSGNTEKTRRYAGIIHEENRRLQTQVERVLQAARLENGTLELALEPIDLHQLIATVLESFQPRVLARQGRLDFVAEARRAVVRVDRFHLANAIGNLLDNAEKYSPDTPDICVETRDEPEGLVVSIRDKGLGIAADQQDQIFEPFYRVGAGDRHETRGFGLGLSYVRMIVEAHGGRIRLESRPREGSRFWFLLPQHEFGHPSGNSFTV